MTDLNTSTLVGRLCRDAHLSQVGQTTKTEFTLAVNESRKGADGQYHDEASFLDCVLWGKLGDSLQNYLKKGTQIAINGHLHQDKWEKDGQKHSRVIIVVDNLQLLGGNKNNTDTVTPPASNIPPAPSVPTNDAYIPF